MTNKKAEDFLLFSRQLPDDVTSYAYQIFEEGFREIETLKSLKENGTVAERSLAAEKLSEMGIPGTWFRERFDRRYPGYTDEQILMLFSFAATATR